MRHHGKKHFYTVQQVKDANRRNEISVDFGCWSHAAFNTHSDFDTYHQSIGEHCDYAAMKSEMLSSVSNTVDTSWFDIDLSWLEFPDIDWSIFDFFDLSWEVPLSIHGMPFANVTFDFSIKWTANSELVSFAHVNH